MLSQDSTRTRCDLCGSNSHSLLFQTYDMRYETREVFSLLQCTRCGLVVTKPKLDLQDLGRYYPEGYHSRCNRPGPSAPLRERLFHAIGRRVNPGHLEKFPPGRVLDVGCGTGAASRRLTEMGHEVVGVEFDSNAAEIAAKSGIEVRHEDFMETDLEAESFDVVIMRHSLEHLQNPLRALKKAHRLLGRFGILYICVPNIDSLGSKIFGRYWFPIEVPRHLTHFSIKTLGQALQAVGFEIVKVMYDYSSEPRIIVESLNYIAGKRLAFLVDGGFRVIHTLLYPIGLLVAGISLGSYMNVVSRKT